MMKYNIDDLLKKDKAELEKIKLTNDILQAEEKFVFEKRRYRSENVRFFGIALLTSLISLGSAYFIESFKQKNAALSDTRKEFYELHKSYLLEKEESKKLELACALSSFDKTISSDVPRYQIICKATTVVKTQTSIIENVDTSSKAVKNAIVKIEGYDKQLQDLNQQKLTANTSEYEGINSRIKTLEGSIDKVLKEVPAIQTAANSSEDIAQNIMQIQTANSSIQQTTEADHSAPTRSSVAWFKEGYYLQFEDYRILLQYLDKKMGIQISVCKLNEKQVCNKTLYTKEWVHFGTPFQFSDDGHTHRIKLQAIDHAGKNPFTLAAYVSFETLNAKQ